MEKKPVRPQDHLPKFSHRRQRVIADNFESIPKVEEADLELAFRIRMADLDLNQHVNNVAYMEWSLETVPLEVLKKYKLIEVEISFRGEAFYGDRVISRTQIVGEQGVQKSFINQIVHGKSGKELTRVKSCWEELEE